MPDDLASRIKAAADVRRLYAELFPTKVVRGGKAARCFREDAHAHRDRTPSVQLRPDGFHCHGCGAHGDAFALVEAAHGTDFKDALRWLAGWTGVPLDAQMSGRPGTQAAGLRVVQTSRGLKRQRSRRPDVRAPEQPSVQAPGPSVPQRAGGPDAAASRLARAQPAELPDAQTSRLLADLWALVEPLPLSPAAETWLQGRGIAPAVAHALGCRDFALALPGLRALLKAASPATKRAAGFYGDDAKPWWPLAGPLKGRTSLAGLCIAAWQPGDTVPSAWRWRFYRPVRAAGERLIKTAAQPGRTPLPLGPQCQLPLPFSDTDAGSGRTRSGSRTAPKRETQQNQGPGRNSCLKATVDLGVRSNPTAKPRNAPMLSSVIDRSRVPPTGR